MNKTKRKSGFTLVEIVVVLAIIGILSAVTIPAIVKYVNTAKDAQDEEVATQLTVALNNAATSLGGEIDAEGDYTSDGSSGGELDNILNVAYDTAHSLIPRNSKFVFILELESTKKEEKNTLTVRAVNTSKWKREENIKTTQKHPYQVYIGHDCYNKEFTKSRSYVKLESYSYKGETILGYNITGSSLNEYSKNYNNNVPGLYSFDSTGAATNFTPWNNLKGGVITQDGSKLVAVDYKTANTAELVVDESVKEIGENCFKDAYALERVQLPTSLTKIGLNSFIFSTTETSKIKMDRIYYAGLVTQFKKVKFEKEKASAWLGISNCAEIYCSDGIFTINSECYFILHFDDNGANLGLEDKSIKSKYATHMVQESELPVVSRPGYTFTGWTINGEAAVGTYVADESTTTVVANWSLNTYDIEYEFLYTSDVTPGSVVNSNPATYNITKNITLAAASDGACVFNGFSFDEAGKQPISKLNSDTLASLFETFDAKGKKIKLYGHFAGKTYYTVNVYNRAGTQTDSAKYEKDSTITLPASLGNVDNDKTGLDTSKYSKNYLTWNGWDIYEAGTSHLIETKQALSSYTPSQSVDIKPNYTVTTFVKISVGTVDGASYNATYKDKDGKTQSFSNNNSTIEIPADQDVSYSVTYKNSSNQTFRYAPTSGNTFDYDGQTSFTIKASSNATISCGSSSSSGGTCVVEGTKITMADGSLKNVEDVKAGDLLLVFNHETGKQEASIVVFNEETYLYDEEITYITFANGTDIGIDTEHGFFDLSVNKYVYITEENASEFVGHEFVTQNGEATTLVATRVEVKTIRVYSPVTAVALNYYVDGMLSMPGGIEGMFNIFEYDENLMFDKALMENDINTYGLFTYDDFADMLPEEVYEAFNGKYLKVAIGKGLITEEQIQVLADRYGIYWEA